MDHDGTSEIVQLPPFATIDHDDRRGALWIAAILSLIFVSMTLGARLYVRKHMLGRDDYASLAAVALAVAQYASLFAGMPSGLGTSKLSVTQGNERKNGSLFLASQAVFICGLYMSKFSVLLATERLLAASMKTVQRLCFLLRVFLGLTTLASVLLITVRCSISGLLTTRSIQQCNGLGQRWIIVSILDAVTESSVLAVFYGLVWSLQMRLSRKWTLTLLLGLRIVCPVLTGVYTAAIKSYAGSSDPEVEVMSPLVWQQVALGYSLIASLLIALIPFLKSFHTGMAMNVHNISSRTGEQGSSARSRDRGYRLKNMSKNSSQQDSKPRSAPLSQTEITRPGSRADEPQWPLKDQRSQPDAGLDGQQPEAMVIQKTVDWSVKYEEGKSGGLRHPGLPNYLN